LITSYEKVYRNKLLTSSLKQRSKIPPQVRKKNNESPKAGASDETDKEKVHKGFTRSIIKSNRNMAKGVEGQVWCKNKSGKTRPIMKNIFEMVGLLTHKDMSSFKLQVPVGRDCPSV